MLFEHGAVLYSRADDSFTTPRQVVLTPDGFIYLGMAGIAVSVLHDETGVCVCLSVRVGASSKIRQAGTAAHPAASR